MSDLDDDELRATRILNGVDKEEIKVNEYVKIADGTIAKVIKVINQDKDTLNYYCLDNRMRNFRNKYSQTFF